MADNDDDRISKKVIVEQSTSASGGTNLPMIITIAVIVIALVVFIFLQIR